MRKFSLFNLAIFAILFSQLAFASHPPEIGRNIGVTDTTAGAQNEPAIAINPLDPSFIAFGCISWAPSAQDSRFQVPNVKVFISKDGGLTWSAGGSLSVPDVAFNASADPWLAFGKDGVLHLCVLWFNDDFSGGTRVRTKPSVYAYRSVDGGQTFSSAKEIAKADFTDNDPHYDKPALAAETDPNLTNPTVYVTYAQAIGTTSKVLLARSQDNGLNYAFVSEIDSAPSGTSATAPVPVTGPKDRELYVTWLRLTSTSGVIRVARSTDQGSTFPLKTDVWTNVTPVPGNTLNGGFPALPLPSIAIDTSGGPSTGKFYICWLNWEGQDTDVRMRIGKHDNSAITWEPASSTYRINNDTSGNERDQFFPSVTVSQEGLVGVLFLDERDDAASPYTLYHAYLAEPVNGDFNNMRNVRVSEAQGDPEQGLVTGPNDVPSRTLGDYITLSGTPSTITSLKSLGVWTRAYNNTEDVISATSHREEVYIPHFVDGGGYKATFIVANLDSLASATFDLELFDQAGQALPVLPGGVWQILGQTISAKGSYSVQTIGGATSKIGWARIKTSTNARTASAAFTQLFSGSTVTAEAGLAAANVVSSALFHTPFSNAQNINTGIAIANPTSDTVIVNLKLYDANGTLVSGGETERTLSPKNQFSQLVNDLFPTIPSPIEGSVVMSARKSGTAESRSVTFWITHVDTPLNQFTWFPGISGKSNPENGYSQVANGGGYKTTFRMSNRSSQQTSKAKIELFKADGSPWTIFPGNANTEERTLNPLSSFSIQTVGGGTTEIGWAKFTSDNGFTGVPELIQIFNGQAQVTNQAGTPPYPYYTRCVVPVNWDSTSSVNTGIALALKEEAGATARIELRLYDRNGNQLGSTVTQGLGGSGEPKHVSKNINEWFSGVASPINGTVEVTVLRDSTWINGYVTVSVIRTDGSQWATYPVLF